MSQHFEKVRKILADYTSTAEDKITGETELRDNLSMDDLAFFEVMLSCEDTFKIDLTDEDFDNLKTVDDLVKLVSSKSPHGKHFDPPKEQS